MLGARPARSGDLLAQRLARPKDPHARVARRDAHRLGVVLDGDLVDLDPSQGVRILGLEGARKLGDASAYDVRKLRAAVAGSLELGGELVEAAVRDGLTTLVVDHDIPKHPIEPPDHRVPNLIAPVKASDEGLLDDLFGDGAVANAPLDISEERAVASYQLVDEFLGGPGPSGICG